MEPSYYWVYILLCNNNCYYTGYTTNLLKRYASHVQATGKCKYTRSFKPLSIAQSWKIEGNKAEAMKLERFIKKLSRQQKEKLIIAPELLNQWFPLSNNKLIPVCESVD